MRSTPETTDSDLDEMIALLVEAVLPGAKYRTVASAHAYTEGGRQIEVWNDGE